MLCSGIKWKPHNTFSPAKSVDIRPKCFRNKAYRPAAKVAVKDKKQGSMYQCMP
jgi:hypothetical protein